MPLSTPVLCVVGTRPEAIKMLPVVRALRARGVGCHLQLTGQHPELARDVLDTLGVPPDGLCALPSPRAAWQTRPPARRPWATGAPTRSAWHTGVPSPTEPDDQPLPRPLALDGADPMAALELPASEAHAVAAIRDALLPVLAAVRPRIVLVHGDTRSALAGALAAVALQLPLGHVEAGLRSHDLAAPFPEELFRRRIDGMATWLLAPTETARANLRAEGVDDARIHVTGNTGIDALHEVLRRLPPDAVAPERPTLLVTAHRRENLGEPLARIVHALCRIADAHPDLDLLVPVHPNPVVAPLLEPLAGRRNARLVPPLAYPDFVRLLRDCFAVLTDSGGVQEEAPVLGKPLLVLRDRTERPEGVLAGTARLVGTDPDRIVAEVERLLTDEAHLSAMRRVHSPYGDGRAADRIAAIVEDLLEPGASRPLPQLPT